MQESEGYLYLFIILNITALVILVTIKNDYSRHIQQRTSKIENNIDFKRSVEILKSSIDVEFDNDFKQKLLSSKQYFIQDAIRRSASVTKGQVIEHLAPFLIQNELNSDEMVFIGSPIDLISFTDIDSEKELSIDFLEIKTGISSLSKKQKLIKDAIFFNRVFYKTVHLK